MDAAIVLVIAYVLTMLAMAHVASPTVFEPGLLLPMLNTLFAGLLPICIAVIAMRLYLSNGSAGLLLMACGLLTFGIGAILAGWLIGGEQGPNVNVTIYNTSALAGSLFHFAGITQTEKREKSQAQKARFENNLAVAVTGVVVMVGLLTFATLQGITPTFFVQGSGPTVLRQVVLGTAALLYFTCGLMLMDQFRSSKQPFHYWYALSLLMVALGLMAIFMQKSVGSPLGWLSRSGHYLAATFALIAVLTTLRKARSYGLPTETAVAELFRRVQVSYQVLVEAVADSIVTLDQDLRVIQWNSSAASAFGIRQDQAIGRSFFDLTVVTEGADRMRQRIRALSDAPGESVNAGGLIEIESRGLGGANVDLEVSISGARNRAQLLVVCVFRQSTARRAAEEAERERAQAQLRESEAFVRIVIDTVPGMLAYWDLELTCRFANDAYLSWFGRTATEMKGISMQSLLGDVLFQKNEPFIRAALAGEAQTFERTLTKPNGDVGYTWGQYIPHWKDGKVAGFLALVTDISEVKKAQHSLARSLSDKDALLKEVHHRVKNNLQVITSLLRLESRRSAVPETVSVLKAMQARIHAMAQLHESLYRSGTFASVDLGVYLGRIATQAFQTQVLDDKRVRLRLTMGSVSVGMDQAIAYGLLVNELVSNCLKHGFPDDRSGQVYVELQSADPATVQTDALWRLRVRDTGVGLPADFEDKRKTSLGLILVEDLTVQAGGTLTIQSQPGAGAEFSVVFKALEPVALVMPS